MAIKLNVAYSRVAVRLLMAAGAAALMAGCSDASRFADPFSDPFSSSTAPRTAQRGYDRQPTGGIAPSRSYAPTRVEQRPLAPVASTTPRASTPAPAPAPIAAAAPAAGGSHWSTDGGTPITVGQGESAAVLATRYGVPTDALLRANGFSSAAQVQPGTRLTIPVYRAGGHAAAPTAVAPTPVAAAPVAKAATPKTAEVEDLKRRKTEAAEARQKEAEAKAAAKLAEAKAAEQKLAEAKAAAAKKPEPKTALVSKADAKIADAKALEARKAAEANLAAAKADAKKAEQARLSAAKEAEAAKAAKLAEAKAAKAAEKVAKVAAAPAEQPAPAKVAEAKPVADSKKIDKTTTTASIPPAPAEEEKTVVTSADGKPEFRWPARGRIIQGFSSGGNDGINIAVPEGTAVKAAEGGQVAYAGSELKGYGNLVLIRHPNGFVSAYAHNGELSVKRGETVKRGQTIAKSGQSGNVGSPQLHFELRKGSTPVDPTTYLAGL